MAKITINKFIEDFIVLPLEEKEYLIEIMQKQFIEEKRDNIAKRSVECMENFKKGSVKKGSVEDLYKDLEEND